MNFLFAFFFGCFHSRTTFPMTLPKRGTYVACLDCGEEIAYDWDQMQPDRSAPVASAIRDWWNALTLKKLGQIAMTVSVFVIAIVFILAGWA